MNWTPLNLTVRVGCQLAYEATVPTPALFVLKPRLDWLTFDPRYNVPRIGRVKVAHGADAVNGAFATIHGEATLSHFELWAYHTEGPAPSLPAMTRALPVRWSLPDHGREMAAGEPAARNQVLSVRSPAQLTAANCESFGGQVGAALHGHQSIELDLAHTTFMDCAGLGALTALNKLARRRQGVLRVVNPTTAVRRLFAIVDAGRLFEVVPPADGLGHPGGKPGTQLLPAS